MALLSPMEIVFSNYILKYLLLIKVIKPENLSVSNILLGLQYKHMFFSNLNNRCKNAAAVEIPDHLKHAHP
jgi:hypothetical protein